MKSAPSALAGAPAGARSEALNFRSEESFEESVSETKRHLEARTTLYMVLRKAYEIAAKRHRQWKKSVAIGSEQFVYYDATDAKKCFSPDVFVKVDSTARDFKTWNVWEQGNPDLVVEIVSESDRNDQIWLEKVSRYLAGGVREVVRFDAEADEPIIVWDRVGDLFVERKRSDTVLLECKTLGLFWIAIRDDTYGPQLRLAKDRSGKQILPTPSESEVRLEQELADERRARAQAEHERLIAEQKQHEEAKARLAAEERQREESLARQLAEERQREESLARQLAEERTQQETQARQLAEERTQQETQARQLAEERTQQETQARERLEAEVARMREEMEQLRKTTR
jgi:hypothetical protein